MLTRYVIKVQYKLWNTCVAAAAATHVFHNFYCTFITYLVSIWDPTMRFYKKSM